MSKNYRTDDKLLFLLELSKVSLENIKLADQKSLVLIALNTAIFGGLYTNNFFVLTSTNLVLTMLSVSAFFVLSLSIFLSLLVIYPRHISEQDDQVLMSYSEKANERKKDYIEKAENISYENIIYNLASLSFDSSKIAKEKYKKLHNCILISLLGWVLVFLLFLYKAI